MKKILATGIACLLAACGGGSSGGTSPPPPSPPPPPPPPPPPSNIGGIWVDPDLPQRVFGIITETGGARFNSGRLVFSVPSNDFSNNARFYTSRDRIGLDGNTAWDGTISAQIEERQNFSASWNYTNGIGTENSDTIDAVYSADLYERGSSLDRLVGTWDGLIPGGHSTVITIDPDGSFFGQESSGCVLNGRIRILNPQYNAYSVDFELGNCGTFGGRFIGLTHTADAGTTTFIVDGALRLYATSAEHHYYVYLTPD